MAQIYVLEGRDGVGKSTQVELIYNHLVSKGYKVLKTREPGTPLAPLSMELRKYMLDAQYADQMTPTARELISQAIRSIHIEKVIMPALDQYDYIIQDRGILSGLAYGEACGNDLDFIHTLVQKVCEPAFHNVRDAYTRVVILASKNSHEALERAVSSGKEFKAGDFIEAQGTSFMDRVEDNMIMIARDLGEFNADIIDVTGKDIPTVFTEICKTLNI